MYTLEFLASIIKKKTQGRYFVHGYEYGDDVRPAAPDTEITHIKRVEIGFKGTNDEWIVNIPQLADHDQYPELFNEYAKWMVDEDPEPVSFELWEDADNKYVEPFGHVYYTHKEVVTYLKDGMLEQYYEDDMQLMSSFNDASDTGFFPVSETMANIHEFFTVLGDLYNNPCSKGIPDPSILLKAPTECYWGDEIFYNRAAENDIAILVDEKWFWVNKRSFLKNTPNRYVNELDLMKNMGFMEPVE